MNTTQKALTLALEWLERNTYGNEAEELFDALTAALAEQTEHHIAGAGKVIEQPAQQAPVAYWIPKAEQFCIADPSGRPFAKAWEPLHASPPQRKPLTRDQVREMTTEAGYDAASPQERADFINGIRHGEAAQGIKD